MTQGFFNIKSAQKDTIDGEDFIVFLNLATSGSEIKKKENELAGQIMAIVVKNRLDLTQSSTVSRELCVTACTCSTGQAVQIRAMPWTERQAANRIMTLNASIGVCTSDAN